MALSNAEKRYPHLPLYYHGGSPRKLELEKVPEQFPIRCEPGRKYHALSKANSGTRSVTLCARSLSAAMGPSLDEINVEYICRDCMKKLNKIMGECLYDEQKGEYYHPAPERI